MKEKGIADDIASEKAVRISASKNRARKSKGTATAVKKTGFMEADSINRRCTPEGA